MAATVEAAFLLIDRASGPIRGIRRELRELQADAKRTGLALDEISGPRQARQMDTLARETRLMGSETKTVGREMDVAEGKMRRTEQRVESMERKTKKATIAWSGLGKTVALLKWPIMIAGIGGAIQAVGGLAAGAVALTPKLLDLGGAAAAGGLLFVGMGLAMGTAKLATADLSKALNGNKNALKALTPEGRAFVQVLKSMKPELDRLKSTAQRGLFPGLTDLLSSVKSQAPQIRGIVGQTSKDLGGLASFLGRQVGSSNFMRDLAQLSDMGGRALGAAARSGFYFAQSIERVLLAAGPFTDWLGTAIERFAKMTDREAEAAKESGRLGEFFDRSRKAIIRIGDTGKNVFHALGGVMAAARGTGDDLWLSIDKATKRWDHWSNSVTGQTSMRRWFDDMKPVLTATVGLVGALGKAVASLTQGPEGAQMLNALKDAMPALASGIRSLTSTLGPAAVSAFGSFVQLLGDASGSAGPLTLLARAVGTLASAADALVTGLGPVGHAIGTALIGFSLLRRMKVFDALDTLRLKWQGVGDAAVIAGGEERAALYSGGGGAIGGGGGGVVPIIPRGGSGAVSEAELLALGAGGGLLARGGMAAGAARVSSTVAAADRVAATLQTGAPAAEVAAGASGGLLSRGAGMFASGGRFGRLAGTASKFALPLVAIQGLLGALGTPGNLTTKLQGGASAASFGLIPRPVSLAEKQGKGATFAGGIIDSLNNQSDKHTQQRQIVRLRKTIGQLPGNDALDQNSTDLTTATRALRRELTRREQILHQSEHAQVLALREGSVKKAEAMTADFQHAYEIRAKHQGPEAAMKHTVGLTLNQMRSMAPAGRKVLGENMLAWAHEQEKQNPKLKSAYRHLEDDIKSSFSRVGKHVSVVNDQILVGSTSEWKQIHSALSTQTEQAREDVTKGFSAIQLAAIGSLTSMGFSPSQAHSLVYQIQQGGTTGSRANLQVKNVTSGLATPSEEQQHHRTDSPTRAQGGRLPGRGLRDTVPMSDGGYGAPGELVVNRHTEAQADSILSMFGTRLSRMVGNESRPHSNPMRAKGGRVTSGGISGHPELHAGISKAGELVLSKFPSLSVTSTTSGNHVPGSYHYKGEAVDIGGPSDVMNRAAAWIKSSGLASKLTEGIHNPNLAVKYGQIETPPGVFGDVWAGHANHIHMAVAGALGSIAGLKGTAGSGSGSKSITLNGLKSNLGGIPGALVDSATSMYAAGLGSKVNKALGSGSTPSAGGGGGTSSANQTLGKKMMLAAGYPASEWPALKALWTQESGWNANAVNPSSGASGIPQALGHGNVFSLGDARAQIAWGLNYIKGRYGDPNAAWAHEQANNWYATGGRTGPDWGGWHAGGTDQMVSRPTLFGAGENGPERVTITPSGRGSGGSRLTIAKGAVQINAAGGRSLEAMVERRLEAFAKTLLDEIENGAEENEGALMS